MRGFSVFDLVFLAGMLCGVRVMAVGVERKRPSVGLVVRTRWAMLAGALTLGGLIGALLSRLSVAGTTVVLASMLVGIAGAAAARILVRQAVAMPVSDHEYDPRFAMQGVPATVVEAIPAFGAGVVRLPSAVGEAVLVSARSVDGRAIARDVEVAVERIDDGVAFVEAWSVIEARL